eukprot:CAMPEP_0202752992 /NCGR_PEP_ID=MMETSP1388-20130828/13262_1 /ASSEMBLY_ACC=CAM_ASM_000864 /TAXON_ID=37098 /ORGANISM="Isochrysis sp, Strain CCMP1244" /LENGTH=141 /DNA_ID=CAMNT_0049420725 /DNA_START=23 /DNA_END=446 /DNA_ORIENTATION=+
MKAHSREMALRVPIASLPHPAAAFPKASHHQRDTKAPASSSSPAHAPARLGATPAARSSATIADVEPRSRCASALRPFSIAIVRDGVAVNAAAAMAGGGAQQPRSSDNRDTPLTGSQALCSGSDSTPYRSRTSHLRAPARG